jgi:hypothetical protein
LSTKAAHTVLWENSTTFAPRRDKIQRNSKKFVARLNKMQCFFSVQPQSRNILELRTALIRRLITALLFVRNFKNFLCAAGPNTVFVRNSKKFGCTLEQKEVN